MVVGLEVYGVAGEDRSTRCTLRADARTLAAVDAYHQRAGVVLPEPSYNPVRQLLVNNWPVLVRHLWFVLLPVGLLVLGVPLLLRWWARRRRCAGTAGVDHAA